MNFKYNGDTKELEIERKGITEEADGITCYSPDAVAALTEIMIALDIEPEQITQRFEELIT